MMRWTLLMCALLVLSCSDDEPAPSDRINPGSGIVLAGLTVRIGDTVGALTEQLGAPPVLLDLGEAGARFAYPERGIGGHLSAVDGQIVRLTLHAEFTGRTKGGVGVGVDEAAVHAAFGAGLRDVFLQAEWYRQKGISVEWSDGGLSVARIHLFTPDP